MSLPEVGQPAPDFVLPTHDGSPLTLSEQQGAWIVLYFYPKAATPGCTTQACSIRDNHAEYERRGVRVLGVSPDPVDAVAAFREHERLPFTLLADEFRTVCEGYGMWVEKVMYGNKFMGVARATVIIDPDGIVRHVFPKITPKQHDKKVLQVLDELQGAALSAA